VSLPPTVDLVEVALLLLWAFLIGASAGAGLRLALWRSARRPAEPLAAGLPATASTAPPLVAAPVIGPLPPMPVPVAPDVIPAPNFAALLGEAPVASIEQGPPVAVAQPGKAIRLPARRPGETTSGVRVPPPAPVQRIEEGAGEAAEAAAPSPGVPSPTQPEIIAFSEPMDAGPVAGAGDRESIWSLPDGDPVDPLWAAPQPPRSSESGRPTEEDAAMRAIEGSWSPGHREPSVEDAIAASRNAIRAAGAAAMALLAAEDRATASPEEAECREVQPPRTAAE
jgi:hypothetical protein